VKELEKSFIELISEQTANKVLARLDELLSLKESSSFLNRKQVSEMIGISLATLNEYCKQGVLPSYRIGRRVLFKESEINEAITKGLRYSHTRNRGVK
jgi:excisionase family DNA binding protein